MKKIIILLAAAIVSLGLSARDIAENKTYSADLGFSVTLSAGKAETTPIVVDLELNAETGYAALAYVDSRTDSKTIFVAKDVEETMPGAFIFRGFRAVLPDGTAVTVRTARQTEDGLEVAFDDGSDRCSILYFR